MTADSLSEEEYVQNQSLVKVFGDHPKTRILAALLGSPPVNITRIAERANINRTTVYRHLESLEATGLIREVDTQGGRSTFYELTDVGETRIPADELSRPLDRELLLEMLVDLSSAHRRTTHESRDD